MKTLFRLIILILILAIGAVVAILYYADSIAKAAIEKGGSFALGVPTTVERADVQFLSGQFEMTRLSVANPSDFKNSHFLQLDDAGMAVSLGTLREETVELPHLTLNGIDVNLERRKDDANYDVILDNLKRFESTDHSTDEGTRFIVNQIAIRDVVVHADVEIPITGTITRVDLSIDEVLLDNVGSDTPKGLLLAELADVIVKALFSAIKAKGADLLPDILLTDLTASLGELTSLSELGIDIDIDGGTWQDMVDVDGLGDVIPDQIEDVGAKAKDAVEDTLEGLGGLLPGKKDDE